MMYNKIDKKKRRLKPGVEKHLRRIRTVAIIMQVCVFIWAFAMLALRAIHDNIQWHDVGAQCIYLLIFLFWSWVHNFANELLEYA